MLFHLAVVPRTQRLSPLLKRQSPDVALDNEAQPRSLEALA